MPDQPERIPINSLPAQEIQALKDRLVNELSQIQQAAQVLSRAGLAFQTGSEAVETLQQSKEGQPVLLPLTPSLYVSGSVASVESVLVDIGTGYFVEMSVQEARDYCTRRVRKLQDNLGGLQQTMQEKQSQVMQLNAVLQDKLQAQQQQQPKQ